MSQLDLRGAVDGMLDVLGDFLAVAGYSVAVVFAVLDVVVVAEDEGDESMMLELEVFLGMVCGIAAASSADARGDSS